MSSGPGVAAVAVLALPTAGAFGVGLLSRSGSPLLAVLGAMGFTALLGWTLVDAGGRTDLIAYLAAVCIAMSAGFAFAGRALASPDRGSGEGMSILIAAIAVGVFVALAGYFALLFVFNWWDIEIA